MGYGYVVYGYGVYGYMGYGIGVDRGSGMWYVYDDR